jgi:hypothetical protein
LPGLAEVNLLVSSQMDLWRGSGADDCVIDTFFCGLAAWSGACLGGAF